MAYKPTFEIDETADNIHRFMTANQNTFWTILKPLLPYILALNAFDIVLKQIPITQRFGDLGLGGLVAGYFIVFLAISWHRVVLQGPDKYVAADPLSPKKSELTFFGAGLGFVFGLFLISIILIGIAGAIHGVLAFLVFIGVIPASIYLLYKISFYFPARAIDKPLTLSQSYELAEGYFWKIVISPLKAAIKPIMLMFAYIVGVIILSAIMVAVTGSTLDGLFGGIFHFIIFQAPVAGFFQPLITAYSVTALSNYYLHAVQASKARS